MSSEVAPCGHPRGRATVRSGWQRRRRRPRQRRFPGHAEGVAAGVGGQGAVDAPGKVEDVLRVQHAQQAVTHYLDRRTGQCTVLVCQAFLPGCERGSAERDPGVGDVVAGARAGEGIQGAGGEFPGAAGVAVAQQEFCARVPYLRAFQGFAEAFRELSGLGEGAFGFVAVACAEPRSSQACRLCRAPRASAISRRSRSASR